MIRFRVARRRERERNRAAFEQPPGCRLRVDVAPRGAVLGAEDDDLCAPRDGEIAKPLGRRRIVDDVEGDVRGRIGLRLVVMTDVRELERCARAGQDSAERERIAVVVGPVVLDDDRRHACGAGIVAAVAPAGRPEGNASDGMSDGYTS